VIVDTTGKITAKYNYYPFGDNLNSSVSQGSEYKYTGKELDEEGALGLYYYGARYYNAKIGRFTTFRISRRC
jgi:RHS repeat-associated protein